MCNVCLGYSGVVCPVCGEGALTKVDCPDCEGLGHKGYFAYDTYTGKEISCTENAWLALPMDEHEAERLGKRYCRQELDYCWRCDGEGYIIV